MISSGLVERAQINKVCGRLLAKESEYPSLPAQKAQEDSLGKLLKQDARQVNKRVGNNTLLIFFLKILMR